MYTSGCFLLCAQINRPLSVCARSDGGPSRLRTTLEGESLLNDASGITLFTIFLQKVEQVIQGHPTHDTFWSVFGNIVGRTAWLAFGAPPCSLCAWLQLQNWHLLLAVQLLPHDWICFHETALYQGCLSGRGGHALKY